MGIILAENGVVETSGIAQSLTDLLPDDMYILAQPHIYGVELDWLVVAPSGLYHLDVRDWQGEVRARQRDTWTVQPSSGRTQEVESPVRRLEHVQEAVAHFLRDEAPALEHLKVTGFLVFDEVVPSISGFGTELPVLVLEDALNRILADEDATVEGLATPQDRESIAHGFLDRRLALRQPAKHPFVLSVGGTVRARLSARNIEQLLRLLDRHPRAGVRHMMDGSLESWLEEEGALHLARRLRESVERLSSDGRAALESFMAGSGYVALPRSSVRPRKLDLGYATPDDIVRKTLSVHRSRGRGYVHGEAGSPETWITVEPSRFSGNCLFTVTADASNLPVGRTSESVITVRSDVGGTTHEVPVALRVRPVPSLLLRRLIRPFLGLVAGVLLGWVLGSALANVALGKQAWSRFASGLRLATIVLWGAMGLLRGVYQAAAWPTPYAIGRWLLRVAAWAAVMVVLVFGLLGLVVGLFPAIGLAQRVLDHWGLLLLGLLALAVLPGSLDDVAHGHATARAATLELANRLRKRRLRALVAILVSVLLIVSLRVLRPAYLVARESPVVTRWIANAGETWESAEQRLEGFIDGVYVRAREETKPGRTGGINQALEWLGIKR